MHNGIILLYHKICERERKGGGEAGRERPPRECVPILSAFWEVSSLMTGTVSLREKTQLTGLSSSGSHSERADLIFTSWSLFLLWAFSQCPSMEGVWELCTILKVGAGHRWGLAEAPLRFSQICFELTWNAPCVMGTLGSSGSSQATAPYRSGLESEFETWVSAVPVLGFCSALWAVLTQEKDYVHRCCEECFEISEQSECLQIGDS